VGAVQAHGGRLAPEAGIPVQIGKDWLGNAHRELLLKEHPGGDSLTTMMRSLNRPPVSRPTRGDISVKRALIAQLLLPVFFSLIPVGCLFAATDELKIAMVLWRGETPAEQGFKEKLKELGYTVHYTTMNAAQDKGELGRLVREDLKANARDFDYVYTFGTTVSKAVRIMLRDEVPQIFNIVAAPVEAGLVESMQSPGRNVTGVTNAIPLSLQLDTARKVIGFKRLGLIFNPREKNSMAIRRSLKEISQTYGFKIVDLKSPPARNALENNLAKLKDGSIVVDAVYLPQDSFVVSNAELIGNELKSAKVKSIGSIKKYIVNGALMGVVPDYNTLGREAAIIVDRHRKGENFKNISVQLPREALLIINRSTSQALQMDIPEQFTKNAIFVD
jgi:ABC-type uncharacterized transport system substrate-binding protein